jgi:hypothetical protein
MRENKYESLSGMRPAISWAPTMIWPIKKHSGTFLAETPICLRVWGLCYVMRKNKQESLSGMRPAISWAPTMIWPIKKHSGTFLAETPICLNWH